MQTDSGRDDSPWIVSTGEQAPEMVEALLKTVPEWFGIEESNTAYVESARHLPTYLARPRAPEELAPGAGPGADPVGVLLATRHFPGAAEIHLMAVARTEHRRGVGRALVTALERDLVADGVTLLQVKTSGPSYPDVGYAKTRLFYQAMGFEPLEELADFWPTNPCLIMIKVLS
ncbi:MAG TPA: GNAT family N-acetyltransferase [Streptosporangiaceae bacterium]|nr:GNAT family N-acetyltransferase [Streptosporangiaceae bacterium]